MGTTDVCNFCGGVGRIQSFEVTSMQILREAEEHLIHNSQNEISIVIHPSMSAYILNNKKQNIFDIEKRHNVEIIFNIENNFSISEYKVVENEEIKTADLKVEIQHKEKMSKKRNHQKKTRDKIDDKDLT